MVAVQRFVEKHSLAIKVNERPVRGDWERVVEQLASLPPRDGLAWAVQCARLVVQLAEFGEQMGSPKGSMETREECMARNVQWILSESKGAKAMLWAHNFHVMTAPDPMGVRTMGMRLRSLYAQQMVTIGFAFGRGSFQAYSMERRLREFTRDEAPAESLDAELAAIGIPAYALDLRAAPSSGPVAEWLAKAHTTRNVMASYVEGRPEYITFEQELKGRYDCLVFVAETTAVRGLP
jgi:erythromycin esterase